MKNIVLQGQKITKIFPGVKALNQVDFQLKEGEIHALMGENGAGKSTLIKVLTGVLKHEGGTIYYQGKACRFQTPKDAQDMGISTVYQEVNLCANLSVAENIYIGREPKKVGKILWKKMEKDSTRLLESLHIDIDVRKPLASFSIAIQQMVAIARAVDIKAKVLILDEPTSSLDQKEVEELFQVMNDLKGKGIGIVFITHFIDQVYAITDRITVLRNGTYVGTYETQLLPYLSLVSKMIGKEFEAISTTKVTGTLSETKREKLVEWKAYGKKGTIEGVDMAIYPGEVLGLAGLLGSGRTEIARLLFGIDRNDQGTMVLHQKTLSKIYPGLAVKEGLALCPEDRKVDGIVSGLSVRENMILALQGKRGLFKPISMKEQVSLVDKYIDMLSIKVSSMEQNIESLSGGNQQKVILARWLLTQPKLLILDEPTRGIDIGSRTEIQKLIHKLASEGMTIIVISSETDELVKLCHRLLVLRDRKVIGSLAGDMVQEDRIMNMIATGGA